MTFDEYQQRASEFAVYPKDREREYLALGLISEVGELAGKVKKEIRDDCDLSNEIIDEAGDVMWYAAEEEIAEIEQRKAECRAAALGHLQTCEREDG